MAGRVSKGWLGPMLRPLRPLFLEVFTISLFVNLLALVVPIFVLQVYDRVVAHAGITTLEGLVIGVALALAFDNLLRQLRSRLLQRISLQIDVNLSRQLFNKFLSLPLRDLEARPAAYWQMLFRDVENVRNTLGGAQAVLVADLPFAVLFLTLVFIIATPIAWVLLVALPIFILVAWRSGAALRAAAAAEQKAGVGRDNLIGEIIAGRATVKALALDQAVAPQWEERQAATIERALARGRRTDGYSNLGASLGSLVTVSLTTVGALAIVDQQISIGALVATNMLSNRIVSPFNQLVGGWRNFVTFRQSLNRLGEVLALPSERLDSPIQLQRPKGQITLETLSFAYQDRAGRPVLDKLQLQIMPNGLHAIVGRNGSGKTTLLKLIQGLYPPASGRVLLDGADIAQFGRHDLARWIGYVPQECVLLAGTIKENIARGRTDLSDEEILNAAQLAGVHAQIVDFPQGYGTDVGEGGGRLSGGQRQRIAIARALVGDPPILLLDEPSGSLDRKAEEDLRAVLAELARDHTILIVTHSPILLAACHNVIALDAGRLVMAGPAREVLPKLAAAWAPGPAPVAERKA